MAVTDSLGALKQLTPAVLLQALSLVREGRVYRLAHTLEPAVPQLPDCPDIARGQRMSLQMRITDLPKFGTQIFSDWVSFETHTGTHIDAFSHWSKDGRMFGGGDPRELYSEEGMRGLGLDEVPPLITRGVLIDAAALKEADLLPMGTVLQPEDLQSALERQRLSVRTGDAVLVRTGWAKNWGQPGTYMTGAPGLSRRSAEWLADQGCVAICADQQTVDAIPPERPEDRRACHEVCLVERGLHIIENMNLEEISRDRVYEFLFVALAPPLKGGTGFPIQAVAVI